MSHINSTTAHSNDQPKAAPDIIIWFVVFIIAGFVIFILNFATLMTFVINKHLRRRSVYCLMNLAVADMLYGIFRITQQSFGIAQYLGRRFDEKAWTTLRLLGHLVFFSSLFCLVLVSLERVYATYFPFRHRSARLRLYVLLVIITWLLPLLPTLTSYLLPIDNNYYLIASVSFLVCLIIICASYIAIFVKVKKRPKTLQMNEHQKALQIAQKREQHLAMTLFIVTTLSLLTWFPVIIFLALQMWYTSLSSALFSSNVSRSIWLIQTANSLINPVIYVFRMKDFRKALLQLVFKCSRHRNRIHPTVVHHAINPNTENQQDFGLSRIG